MSAAAKSVRESWEVSADLEAEVVAEAEAEVVVSGYFLTLAPTPALTLRGYL